MRYIFFPCFDSSRLDHYLSNNLIDIGPRDPLAYRFNKGDNIVFCLSKERLVLAKAVAAGPVFALPRDRVLDPDFPMAIRLVPGSVFWRHPPKPAGDFVWGPTRSISQAEFDDLISGEAQWLPASKNHKKVTEQA